MKRFAVFAFSEYYPAGGWNDLRGVGDTVAEAMQALPSGYDRFHVVDLSDGTVVAGSLPEASGQPDAVRRRPLQPLYVDKHGTVRFRENAIVEYLIERGPFDMNHLAMQEFSQEDREQFAQLIGYSLGGFEELSYVSDEMAEAAQRAADVILKGQSS